MFYWECKDYQLISNSPELQLKVENGKVIIRPIAGTSKGKGKTKEEAQVLKQELENNPKDKLSILCWLIWLEMISEE